jgi:ribonuclease HII
MKECGMVVAAKEVVSVLAHAPFEEIPALVARYESDSRKQVQVACERARKRYAREAAERERVEGMYATMRELGGAVAGPLTVAAVVLPDAPVVWGLNDSKQLTPHEREALAPHIQAAALAIGIEHIAPEVIDEVGMACALRMAMLGALEKTGVEPDCVLIDGNPMHLHPKEKTLVKGDAKIAAIAAASVVAKVTRDAMMVELDSVYPGYGFAKSKGYASAEHRAAIAERGLTPVHRKSFCEHFVAPPSLFD